MKGDDEEPGDDPGEQRDDALNENADEEDRTIEEERQRSAMLKLLEVLLSDEAGDRHGGERPKCQSPTTRNEGRPEHRQNRQDEHHLRGVDQVSMHF